MVARKEVRSAKGLEGEKVVVTDRSACVFGNLKHAIQVGGANLEAIEFVSLDSEALDANRQAVQIVARGEAAAAQVDMPFDL